MIFDIVIPVGPNDKDKIKDQLYYTKKNIIGYRKIFIITDITFDIELKGVVIVPEHFFPFYNQDIIKGFRKGWYLQQLYKLYAGYICPDILPSYLVIDCDTFFLKKTHFWENDTPLYNYGKEYHKPYFIHMDKLIPGLRRIKNISGITHHMIFEKKYIELMFNKVNEEFWIKFLKNVDQNENSGCSEYELYFNFMLQYYPENMKLRKFIRFQNLI